LNRRRVNTFLRLNITDIFGGKIELCDVKRLVRTSIYVSEVAVADYDDLYRRAAIYVDKILKGAKPAELPVQQATKFEFIVNVKAAKQIGLVIPNRVLERANQVIK